MPRTSSLVGISTVGFIATVLYHDRSRRSNRWRIAPRRATVFRRPVSPLRAGLIALLAASLAARAAAGFEASEIAAASAVARAVGDDVRWLAADALEGRGSGTAGGALAEELLIDQLESIGPGLDDSRSGRDAYRQDFDAVRTNLLAVVPGGARADEFVVVGAHYDHFPPYGCVVLDDPICNGASDDAAGVAVVLAIGRALRALPAPPARSVVLALWDGEELGLLGSKYFVAHPLVPLADVAAYVNFDIQGADLAPSVRDVSFAVGTESGGELLTSLTQQAIDAVGLSTQRLSVNFGQGRSDYRPFWGRQVPIAFFSDATNACYHTTGDEIDVVNFRKLSRQAEIGFRLVVALAESEARPAYTPTPYLDSYDDLLVLSGFLTRALGDLDVIAPGYREDLVSLEALARQRVDAGPGAFSPTDALTIAQDALTIATQGLPCDAALLPEPGAGWAASAAISGLVALAARRRA